MVETGMDVHMYNSEAAGKKREAASLISSDISTSLSKGWYVNIPDHEGPLAGITEGYATIDSIRAVLNTFLSKDQSFRRTQAVQ